MRIAFFAWESLHSVAVGGMGRHVTELAAALNRRGNEVHVFARMGKGQSCYQLIDGVHYHRCPIALNHDFVTEMNNMGNSFVYFMGETEAHQGARFDIVHGHDWMCAKGLVQAKNDRGNRTVMTFHSTEYGRCGNGGRHKNSDRIYAVEAEGAYCADRLIAVSSHLADEVKWLYKAPDWKLRVAYNGVSCHRYDGFIDPAVCRRSYGIGPLDPMVLFVGRLSTQKGPDLLLEAVPEILRQWHNAKFVFVGDGDMLDGLKWRAGELHVSHAVRFTGAMDPDSDVINLFKSTDLVCVPSRNEPFGIVVLESWAAGKPVVVTRNGGPLHFVKPGVEGHIVHANPASIAWGIREVFSNFQHARWMGERGRVKAAYEFSWDNIAARTEAVYREVL